MLILIYIILLLSYSLIFGAPFASLGRERIKTMFELLDVKKGKKSIDIGSGDGRIVIASARHGLFAYGVEINPVVYLVSLLHIRRNNIKNANILMKDFWQVDLSSYDYITVWGTKHMLRNLEKKLLTELKSGTKVASNHSRFPNWKHTKTKNDVYLYIK